jgi:prepilin-type processing-associated H-X9-DG protein
MNAGHIPADHWVHSLDKGGGRNVGEACHVYDLFGLLTGAEAEDVTSRTITPEGDHYTPRDNFTATVAFADGSVATLTYTALGATQYPKERMEVFCDGVVYSLDDYRSLEITGSGASGLKTQTQDKGHKAELAAFADAVRDGEWPEPLWQQVQAMGVAFAVEEGFGV